MNQIDNNRETFFVVTLILVELEYWSRRNKNLLTTATLFFICRMLRSLMVATLVVIVVVGLNRN